MNTPSEQPQHEPGLMPVLDRKFPQDIYHAAALLEDYFAREAGAHWEFMGIADRGLVSSLQEQLRTLRTPAPVPEDGGTLRYKDHIKGLEAKCVSQAAELTRAQATLKERADQLTAMHWVWCSGSCGEPLSKETIEIAVRNTDRMIDKFNGQNSNRAWKSLNEWPEEQEALVKAWRDITTALRENAALKSRLSKWEGETHEGYTDSPAKVNESLRAQLTEMKKSAEADFEIYHQVRLALVAAGCNEFKLVPEMLAELVDKRDALQSANAVLRGALEKIAARLQKPMNYQAACYDGIDLAKEALQSPSPAMVPVEDVKGWTQDHPKESGLYWLWQGDEEQSPFPVTVMYSGTSGKCFVATGHCGWTRHQEFEELEGAWWMPCVEPKHPSLK